MEEVIPSHWDKVLGFKDLQDVSWTQDYLMDFLQFFSVLAESAYRHYGLHVSKSFFSVS